MPALVSSASSDDVDMKDQSCSSSSCPFTAEVEILRRHVKKVEQHAAVSSSQQPKCSVCRVSLAYAFENRMEICIISVFTHQTYVL